MSKQIKNGAEARQALAKGIDTVANAVKVTLGPAGRLVVLSRPYGLGTVTKDGVTVAREISLSDPFENEGAKQCIEAASKSNVDASDGTTTATVLAQSLIHLGMKEVEKGVSPVKLVKELDKELGTILSFIDDHSKAVASKEDIQNIATISGNDAKIGSVVAEAFDEVGESGVVSLETWKGSHVKIDYTEGYSFERGYITPYFVTHPDKMRVEYDDAIVAVVAQPLRWAIEAAKLLDLCTHHKKPLIIICEDCEGEALETILMNHVLQTGPKLPVVVVKGPGHGQRQRDLLDDIAVFTGATIIATELGLDFTGTIPPDVIGSVRRVVIDSENTVLLDGEGKDIEARCEMLKTLLSQNPGEMKHQERLTKLTAGAAVIRVGATTETELTELKHRYEDALGATRAAIKEGIVPGGGVTLIQASKLLNDGLLKEALLTPCMQIASNAGLDGAEIVNRIQKEDNLAYGYDAKKEVWGDLLELGVIDPALVAKSSLKNAVSIAKLVLSCEAVIVEEPKDGSK